MLKFKKYLFIGAAVLPAMVGASVLSSSCVDKISNNTKTYENLKFSINKPWGEASNKDNFFYEVINKINENKKGYKVNNATLHYLDDNVDFIKELQKGTADIACLTPTVYNLEKDKSNIHPFLQTMTRAFVFDQDFNAQYSNGLDDDPLRKIAQSAFDLFNKKPFENWDDKEYKWNGSIYESFYANKDKLVDYYRGLVAVWGTQEELKAIKEAWNKKDWKTFRNFGIMHGSSSSGSKYLLQEALFKKHFNLKGNEFKSFLEDKQGNEVKYIKGKIKNIGKGAFSKYHIVFDDLGSFAYTHSKGSAIYKLDDKNSKIEFLTVTEPLKYNIFATSSNIPKELREIIANAMVEVWKEGKDTYGPTVGFNGYKIINDPMKEVILPYKNVFNIN
ncbi:ABC transporter thiamine pyrophosphate-binding lipoprotein p37/Cypl [Metamycoplasma hominis]|uniref:ABC transporter thiamine pyrophosphate-binding lipoprotein p37/Cypl n=1 Tax=Metamycoplasma hominis TaxID=2098 RepID=UPI001939CA59|nr:ABC transporter substrate-binding protein [Metamycoplasma hominis]